MDSPIAVYYLREEGDDQNRLWLTKEHLYVITKGKLRRFDLERIKQLSVEERRWWFPVVAGGILAPLSLLAILLNLYNPWWLISLLVGSLLLWYWGATQHEVLAIHQHHHRQDVPLPIVSQNLREFIRFANRYLRQGTLPFYIEAEPNAWQVVQEREDYRPEELQQRGFITAHTEESWKNLSKREGQWLAVDPLKIAAPVRYVSNGKQLVPRIYGAIPREAITLVAGRNLQ